MKKILLLLCSLFVAIGTWADGPAVDGKTFTLQCKRGYVYYDGSVVAGTTESANASKFAFVTYEENTYLYDATQKAFVCHTTAATAGTTGNNSLESKTDFSKAVTGLKWGETSIAAYPYYLEDSFENWLNMDGTPKVYFNTWKDFEGGNGGNTYKVEVVDETFDNTEAVAMLAEYFHPSATVTYVISDANGVVFTSEAIPAKVGATIEALPTDLQRPYCSYNVAPVTVVTGDNPVNVTVSYALPFTASESVDDAVWYYAKLRGTKFLRADDSKKDSNGRYQTSTTNEETDIYKWAFVGNPYSYFKIFNRGKVGEYLSAGDVPTFVTVADPVEAAALWEPSSNSNGGFNIRSITGANLYINDASGAGNLGYWNSTWAPSDAGSNWVIEAVPTFGITIAAGIENGSVAVSATTVHEGDVIKPIITPAEGYMLKSLTVKAGEDDVTLNYDNSFTMPAADVTISAEFQDKVYIETDLTAQFGLEPSKWTGASGWCASSFGPTVTTNDGRSTLLAENYQGNASATGDLIKQTLSGLANGTYRIEIYAAAASTHERDGFATDVQAGDTDAAEVYAKAGGVRTSKALTAFVATSFSEVNTCVLDNVEVTDGTVEIGLTKLSAKTNWHIIQIKGVTAKVDAGSLLAVAVAAAAAVDPTTIPAKLAADIATAVEENNKAYTTAEEYKAAIAAIGAVVAKAAPYAPLTAALAKGEAYKANVAAGSDAITTYETAIAGVQAAYDAVTVTDFDAAVATVNAALPALAKAQTADGSDLTVYLEGLAWTCVQGNGPGDYGAATETYLAGNDGYAPGKVMYQHVEGLVPGTYTVKFYATANHAREGSAFGNDIAQLYANDVTENIEVIDQDACTITDYERTLTASVGEDGVLEYGLQNIAQGGQWYVAKAISLTLVHAYSEIELAYVSAQKTIVDGNFYNITTVVNETTYYLTTGGKLTAEATAAGAFKFKAVNGAASAAYPTGWNLGCKFTNPSFVGGGSTGDIDHKGQIGIGGNDRDTWERQVFFLKDGKYAVRATNNTGTNWGANTYWDVVEGSLPTADYSLDMQYKWNLVDISTEIPRKDLLAEIEKANAAAAINVGTAAFQIPTAAAETLLSAVATAQGVYDNGEATAQALNDAKAALQAAEATFAETELNAPADGQLFNIVNVSAGYNHAGKAVTFKSAADADLAANTTAMGWTELPGSIYPQAVKFTAVEGEKNVYTLSYTRADGNTIYVSTGITSGLGSAATQIRPTTDAAKALKVRVEASATADTWYLWNTEAGKRLGANGASDQGFFTGEANGYKYYDMKLQEAVKNEVALSIKAADQYGTIIVPFSTEIPDGMKAYSVSEVDGTTLTLVEAVAIAANTPYIVFAEAGIETTLAGVGASFTQLSYTEGLLTGVYADITAEAGKYVLQNQGSGVAFYLVDAVKPSVKANHAYLTAPSAGVKAFYLGEVATAIEKVMAGAAAGEIYDLAGRKVSRMVKGNAYIVGGRKVVIK